MRGFRGLRVVFLFIRDFGGGFSVWGFLRCVRGVLGLGVWGVFEV